MKIKKTPILLLLGLAMTLGACAANPEGSSSVDPSSSEPASSESSSAESSSAIPEKEELHVKLDLPINSMWKLEDEEAKAEYEFDYKDAYFLADNKVRNDDLALASLCMSGFNDSKENINRFLGAIHYTRIYNSPCYTTASGIHDIAYTIAQKRFDDVTALVISIKGFEYGMQMAGNFFLGESGDHEDFSQAADQVYTALGSYLEENPVATNKVKLWINGYSRTAAVGNLLAKKIYQKITNNEFKLLTSDDIYGYFFETPLCADNSEDGAYPFIFNYINDHDFITHIPPAAFGFKLLGTTIDIYNEKMGEIVTAFDKRLVLNDFQPYYLGIDFSSMSPTINPDEKSSKDLREYTIALFEKALQKDEGGTYADLSTRAKYFNLIEKHIEYAVNFVLGISAVQLVSLVAKVMDNPTSLIFSVIAALGAETADDFIKIVEDLLDKASITYDKSKLEPMLTDIRGVITLYFTQYVASADSVNTVNGILSIVKNTNPIFNIHLFETTYALFKYMMANPAAEGEEA